jgi:glutamine synthetase
MLEPSLLTTNGIRFVETKFLDFNGILRSRTFPVNRYLNSIRSNGFGFDGSSIGFFPIEDSDTVAIPIEETMRMSPCKTTAFVFCDIQKNGKQFQGFGKNILENLLKEIPYKVLVGPEVEFYLTKSLKPIDDAGYMHSSPMDTGEVFKKEVLDFLLETNSDLNIHVAHHEVGPSQHEVELKYDEPIRMIHKLLSYRYILRKFAEERNLEVTYMPKPFFRKAGSGMHFHISLWNDEKNLFYKNENDISDTAKQFIAGILYHSREISLVTNGTVNSYKRLVKGHEAPVFCVWGFSNRSALIRIPKYRRFEPSSTRIEVRSLDGLNDPFLTCAALIRAGINGIKRELEAPKSFQGNAYKLDEKDIENNGVKMLPKNLSESIEEAKNGTILKEVLGNMFEKFIKTKEKEWKEYCKYLKERDLPLGTKDITNWELIKYFYM